VEYGAAMFPDAPSARALKHLEELAALHKEAYICHVLFVVVHGNPKVFIPNLHTDPAFSAALSRVEKPVKIHAALIRCDPEGNAVLINPALPVDLSHGKLAGNNSGSYLVVLEIPKTIKTEIGALGTLAFKAGWYVYAGSAMKNLSQRVSRHLRKIRKQKHWHLDYLSPFAKSISALPIVSYKNLECNLASTLEEIGGKGIPGFGSSDCRGAEGRKCISHLFYFKNNPMENQAFVELVLRFRHEEWLRLPFSNRRFDLT
jgi:sugar fermentation stimulation protein A